MRQSEKSQNRKSSPFQNNLFIQETYPKFINTNTKWFNKYVQNVLPGRQNEKRNPCLFVIVPGTKPNRQHEAATIAFLRYRTLLQVCFPLLGLFNLPKADLIIFLKKLAVIVRPLLRSYVPLVTRLGSFLSNTIFHRLEMQCQKSRDAFFVASFPRSKKYPTKKVLVSEGNICIQSRVPTEFLFNRFAHASYCSFCGYAVDT